MANNTPVSIAEDIFSPLGEGEIMPIIIQDENALVPGSEYQSGMPQSENTKNWLVQKVAPDGTLLSEGGHDFVIVAREAGPVPDLPLQAIGSLLPSPKLEFIPRHILPFLAPTTVNDTITETLTVVDPLSAIVDFDSSPQFFVTSTQMASFQEEGALIKIDMTPAINTLSTAPDFNNALLMIQVSLPHEIYLAFNTSSTVQTLGSDLYVESGNADQIQSDFTGSPNLSAVNGLSGDNYTLSHIYFHVNNNTQINTGSASVLEVDAFAFEIPAGDFINSGMPALQAALSSALAAQGVSLPIPDILYISSLTGLDTNYTIQLISLEKSGVHPNQLSELSRVTKDITIDPSVSNLIGDNNQYTIIRVNDTLEIQNTLINNNNIDVDGSESYAQTFYLPVVQGGYQLAPSSIENGWSLTGNVLRRTAGLSSLANREALFQQILPLGVVGNANSIFNKIADVFFNGDTTQTAGIAAVYANIQDSVIHARQGLDILYNPDANLTMFDPSFGSASAITGFVTAGMGFQNAFVAAGGNYDIFMASSADAQQTLLQNLFMLNTDQNAVLQAQPFALDASIFSYGTSYGIETSTTNTENLQDSYTYDNTTNNQITISNTISNIPQEYTFTLYTISGTGNSIDGVLATEAVNSLLVSSPATANINFEIKSQDLNSINNINNLYNQALSSGLYINSAGTTIAGAVLERPTLQKIGIFNFSLNGAALDTFISDYASGSIDSLSVAFTPNQTMIFQFDTQYTLNGIDYFSSDIDSIAHAAVGNYIPQAALPGLLFNVAYGFGNETLALTRETLAASYRNNFLTASEVNYSTYDTLNINPTVYFPGYLSANMRFDLTLPTLSAGYEFEILSTTGSSWSISNGHLIADITSSVSSSSIVNETVVLAKVSTGGGAPVHLTGSDTTIDAFFVASHNSFGPNDNINDPTENTPHVILPVTTDNLSTLGTNGDDVFLLLDTVTTIPQPIGTDTYFGGSGNDSFVLNTNRGNINFFGGAGNDSVELTSSANTNPDLIYGGSGNDTITVDAIYPGTAYIDAGSGDDIITISSNSPTSNALAFYIADGAGDDTISVEYGAPTQFLMGTGSDTYFLLANDNVATQNFILLPAWHNNGDLDLVTLDVTNRTIGNDTTTLEVDLHELYYQLITQGTVTDSSQVTSSWSDNGNGTWDFNVITDNGGMVTTPYFKLSEVNNGSLVSLVNADINAIVLSI